MMLKDSYNREIKDLRISVTDRCNFRCAYCMPMEEYAWIERAEILKFEEIERLARIFVRLGVEKIRITGGEPLVRNDIEKLVRLLAAIPAVKDLSLTTNGSLLAPMAADLKEAGLKRINISLDTLVPATFRKISQRGELGRVLEGVWAAKAAGFFPVKLNAVIERGVNDNEILDLVEFARANGFALRFIEFMDVGNSNHWDTGRVMTKREILGVIASRYGLIEKGRGDGSAPSLDFTLADASGDVGVISSVTEPFCSSCTRARLTADGKLVTCLFSETGHDLKALLRGGARDEEIAESIASVWSTRSDRYSDERLQAMNSVAGYRPEQHRKIEMIRLGG